MPVFTVSNRLWQATALTALLVLLLLAGLGTLLNRRLSEVQGQVVEKEQKVSELLTQNSQTQVENENLALQLNQLTEQNQLLREGQDQAMKELLDAHGRMQIISDADRVVLLRSAQANINARATFYVSDQQGALAVSGFAPLASEQNYQIWLADAENRRYPLALFNVVDTNRPFWKLAQLPAGLSNFVSVFVTIEPASGSAQPTGPILISSVGL
jgi:TolA-binding protein